MKCILLVDDDVNIRNMCKRVINRNGYSVLTAENADQALALAHKNIGLVISDYNMPGYDGLWLAERIKEAFKNEIPVIIMTGSKINTDSFSKERLLVDDILPKPFEINHFIGVLNKYSDYLKGGTMSRKKKAAENGAIKASECYVIIDYPQNNEVIKHPDYAIRIGASENVNVELSLNGGEWLSCRFADGFWWYDWSINKKGMHNIKARICDKKGVLLRETEIRKCIYWE